jgi:N-methylhydantoinase A
VSVAIDIGGLSPIWYSIAREGLELTKVLRPSRLLPGRHRRALPTARDLEEMSLLVHGTRTARAFLERKGSGRRSSLTRGFGDVYAIGAGAATACHDLHYRNPEPLVPRRLVYEVDGA